MNATALIEAILSAVTLAVPIVITALVTLIVQWIRVRRAKLRAERLKLPPSTEPPQPIDPWYSLRPRRKRKSGRWL